jgi:hypothetical protein
VGANDFAAKGGPLMALSSGHVVAADGGGPQVQGKLSEAWGGLAALGCAQAHVRTQGAACFVSLAPAKAFGLHFF